MARAQQVFLVVTTGLSDLAAAALDIAMIEAPFHGHRVARGVWIMSSVETAPEVARRCEALLQSAESLLLVAEITANTTFGPVALRQNPALPAILRKARRALDLL